MHPGQLDVTEATVRALVDQQFPAWRDLPVRALPSQGTVNLLFRLGEELVAASRWSRVRSRRPGRGWRPRREPPGSSWAGPGSPRRSRSPSAHPGRATRCPGQCRRGCPAPWLPTRTRRPRWPSLTTWPSSSAASARSRPAEGPSAGPVGEVTCRTTTPGCRTASSAAGPCWTSNRCERCGPGCAPWGRARAGT